MIRINLLPSELQRAARTPRVIFFTLIGGVVSSMLLGVVAAWLWFSVDTLGGHVSRRQADIAVANENAQEVDRINEDIAFYKEREMAIIEIKTRRVLWAPKLDQLVQRTPPGIWLTRLAMETLDRSAYKWEKGAPQTGGTLSLTCFAEGTEVTALTDYRKALTGERAFYKNLVDIAALPDNFFGDFSGFADPSWNRVQLADFAEQDFLRFVLDLHLRPRFEPPAPEAPAKKPARKAAQKTGK